MAHLRFRAWDKNECKMLHDSELRFHVQITKCVRIEHDQFHGFEKYEDVTMRASSDFTDRWWKEINRNFTIMQSTGLTDKNGREIFEGDILGLDDPEDDSRCYVIFKDGSFRRCFVTFDAAFDTIDMTLWVVIGNIHENPDLLAA